MKYIAKKNYNHPSLMIQTLRNKAINTKIIYNFYFFLNCL